MRLGPRLLLALALALALVLAAGSESALAQSIEIASDLAGTIHEGAVLPGTTPTVYILVRTGGCVSDGITGAEFWVSGLPASWITIVTPNPANAVALGNPFATVPPLRANIAFPTCMPPDGNGMVWLYSVVVIPTNIVGDACLTPEVAIPPSNLHYTTPILTWCNWGDGVCPAAGIPFLMNPVTGGCVVAVESVTWGAVKHLFGE